LVKKNKISDFRAIPPKLPAKTFFFCIYKYICKFKIFLTIFTFLRYTIKGSTLYALITNWPTKEYLSLATPRVQTTTIVSLLGYNGTVAWKPMQNGGLKVNIDQIRLGDLVRQEAWVFKLMNVQ